MNEKEREEDIKKHLNVDFGEEDEGGANRRISVDELNLSNGLAGELGQIMGSNENTMLQYG